MRAALFKDYYRKDLLMGLFEKHGAACAAHGWCHDNTSARRLSTMPAQPSMPQKPLQTMHVTGRCVVRDSESGHQLLLLPPANWCPIFASRTTHSLLRSDLIRIATSAHPQPSDGAVATGVL